MKAQIEKDGQVCPIGPNNQERDSKHAQWQDI